MTHEHVTDKMIERCNSLQKMLYLWKARIK